MIHYWRILAILLAVVGLIGVVSGYQEDFQNGATGWYGPSGAVVKGYGAWGGDYDDLHYEAQYLSSGGRVGYGVPIHTNYIAFDYDIYNAYGYSTPIYFLDSSMSTAIGNVALYGSGHAEFIKIDNSVYRIVRNADGTVNTQTKCFDTGIQQIYGFNIGGSMSGCGVLLDNVVITPSDTVVLNIIPTDWYISKDLADPTFTGLYDSSETQIYSTMMHASWSFADGNFAGSTISIDGNQQATSITALSGFVTFNLTQFTANNNYGIHYIELVSPAGTQREYFTYKAIATTSSGIDFDRNLYAPQDSVVITSTLSSEYYKPGLYSYKGCIYDQISGEYKENWSITNQNDVHTTTASSNIFPASGEYLAILYATDSQGNEMMLDSDTCQIYTNKMIISGIVYDAQQGTVLSGATVALTQSGSTTTQTTGSDGAFEFSGLSKDVLTSLTTSKSGYTTAYSNSTPTEYKRYDVQIALAPSAPTHTATTVFGTVKCYPLGSFVASPAVRILKDGVLINSTTATEKGFYIFDNLDASTTYTIETEKAGYLDYSNAVVTGTANSLTEMDPMMVPTYSITVVLKDSLTQQTITGLMAVSLGDGQSVQTSTGSATFTAVGMGTNSIAVVGSGYTAQSSTQSITGDQTITLYITPAAVVPTTAVAFTTTPTPAIVNMGGTVYDGMTGGTISGATVNVTVIQDSISRFDIADSSGVYSVPNIQNNVLVTVNATAAGYTHTAFTFTPVGSTEYLVDLYMYRIDEATNPTHDPVVGQAGAGGMVLGGPYHELVESPTVTASNGTWSGTATIDSGHSWYFTNLEPNSAYNFTVSAAGFVTRTVPATTGAGDSFTVVPVILDGVYDITIQIKEVESSSLILQPVQVTCSNGVTQNTSTGSTTFTNLEYATFVFTATCEGYQQGGTSVLAYASHTESLYMTKIPTSADNQIQYSIPPKNVELVARNMMGVALNGVTVSAQGQSTTLPDTSMLGAIFGWTEKYSDVNLANATMTGVTGSDGAISFLMADSVNYQIKFTDPARGIDETVELMPHDSQYLFFLGSNPGQTPVAGMPNMTVWATDVNSSTPILHGHYFDQVGHTTSVTFIVETQNGTPVHNQTWTGQQTVDTTYTVPHVKGAMYVYGFRASTTDRGELEKWDGITLHSRLVDLGIEEGYYFWISLCFLIPFAGIFSGMTVKYGFILLPLFAGLLFYIGWLEISATILTIAIVLGVLMYITKVQVS